MLEPWGFCLQLLLKQELSSWQDKYNNNNEDLESWGLAFLYSFWSRDCHVIARIALLTETAPFQLLEAHGIRHVPFFPPWRQRELCFMMKRNVAFLELG